MNMNKDKVNRDDIYAALASPVRRKVLGMLRKQAMTAGDIADEVSVSKPTLSGHLKILKSADLIHVERQGAHLLYRINLSVAEEALTGLMDLFELGAPKNSRSIVRPIKKRRQT